MAKRPAWTIQDKKVVRKEFEFLWNGGFAISQKKKNIINLHNSIKENEDIKVLEVSTKSDSDIGYRLSAFNLKLDGKFLENVFQSSKIYENGGPYKDLLEVDPKQSKRDERHHTSGKILGFEYDFIKWSLVPKTAFYDYIYIKAAMETIKMKELLQVTQYDWFTDIEFNPQKSINCQARSVTILKYILLNDMSDVIKEYDSWIKFHTNILNEE